MATFGKIYEYPNGVYDIVASNRQIYETKTIAPKKPSKKPKKDGDSEQIPHKSKKEDIERAMRRARAKLRRLAMANDFRWFVTLTLDPAKINRYDPDEVVRKMSNWTDNMVRRHGLCYILVPEHHKDGAIHFHGFFNDALVAVKSNKTDNNGHDVYNLPQWALGFTTAIELYGDYAGAVGYVCKYIGKQGDKIGGRWYYSGGKLVKPVEHFVDVTYFDLMAANGEEFAAEYGTGWFKACPVGLYAGVNGLRGGVEKWTQSR